MTDADEPRMGLRVPSELADVPLAEKAPSVGQQLQRARLDLGMSLESLSARLKVSVPRLQAFENNQFEKGHNLHSGRAMVASVARFLGLDAQAVLAQLPQPTPQGPAPGMHEAAGGFAKETRRTMLRDAPGPVSPVWWIALVLLLLAGLIYFYPQIAQIAQMGQAALTAAAPQPSAPAAPATQPEPQDAAVQAMPAASMPEAPALPTALDRGASTLKLAQPVLVFKARGSTWIEVTDAKGTVLLRRTLAASEAAEVLGDLPLVVVVGRADHTDVWVRGVLFSLETHTQDNVARFKVP
ncbi:MAG: helix-turn-helix domain-containing protein [Rhodoferax sp.]|nr:helix-turn-helix domain-containing protein [Rhodoferax sp.]